MSEILEALTQQFGGQLLDNMSQQSGLDKSQTSSVLGSALPILMGALAKNSAQSGGADALHQALAKDHDGSILDDLDGFLGNADSGPGAGILKHVLGGGQTGVEQALSSQTGVDQGSIANILKMAAPILMGMLGKQQRANNIDSGGIADLLKKGASEMASQSPQGSDLISQLLDQDGDGDVSDDIAKLGTDLLGKFLK